MEGPAALGSGGGINVLARTLANDQLVRLLRSFMGGVNGRSERAVSEEVQGSCEERRTARLHGLPARPA